MRHLGTQLIHTKRLVLRPFTLADARCAYAAWCADSRVTQFLRWTPHENVEKTKEIMSEWVENYKISDKYYHWAITLANTGEVIGAIGVFKPEKGDAPEIGYCIAYRHWGLGYTTEALIAVCQFMFEAVGVLELYISHAIENIGSKRCIEKAGFTYTHDDVYHKFDNTQVACKCYLLKAEDF